MSKKQWAVLVSGGILVPILVALVLWTWLPAWAPRFVICHSPWVEPVVRAADAGGGDTWEPYVVRMDALGEKALPTLARAMRRFEGGRLFCAVLGFRRVFWLRLWGFEWQWPKPKIVPAPLTDGLPYVDALIAAAKSPGRRFENQQEGESHVMARRLALHALCEIKGRDVLPDLLSFMKGADLWLRTEAAERLGEVEDERALDHLAAYLDDDEETMRLRVAQVMAKRRDGRSLPTLLGMLESDGTRAGAAAALGELGARAAIPKLIEHLREPDQSVRYQCITSLVRLGATEAVPHITPMSGDRDPFIAAEARKALKKLGAMGNTSGPVDTSE